ncbi:sulfotransferase [Roseovarius sp. Pro17]|uniref:sulfotransferase family protein n=1 Tax=Roseovarius sp. Pro17 TaxID=3108175 RepID=UPI002D7941E6|nr:sulfotransferase [Roseovarius sp. Pro17]
MRNHRKIIFVGGVHRSGTTLVQRIMGTHSQVFAGREFDFTKDIIALRKRLLVGYESGRIADLVTPEDIDHAVEGFTTALFERALEEAGKPILCEKTPSNALVMAELCDSMPEAYCILMMRDPRAIAASMKTVANKYFSNGLRPPPFCASVAASIKDINQTWRVGLEAMSGRDRIKIVYYEDLVSDPETVVKEICQFAGLTYEQTMVEPQPLEDRQTHVSDQFWYTQTELARPITAGKLDNYRTVLSDMEVALIERYVLRHPIVARYELGDASASFQERLAMIWERLKAAKISQKIRAKGNGAA